MKKRKPKYRTLEVVYSDGTRAFFPQMKSKKTKGKWAQVTRTGWLSLDASEFHISRHIKPPKAVETVEHRYKAVRKAKTHPKKSARS